MSNTPGLIDQLRALADDGHPMADELRECAAKLDDAITRADAKATVGAWARARQTLHKANGGGEHGWLFGGAG